MGCAVHLNLTSYDWEQGTNTIMIYACLSQLCIYYFPSLDSMPKKDQPSRINLLLHNRIYVLCRPHSY